MNRPTLILACVATALSVTATAAFATPSCIPWELQPDGSYFRTCVDDQGRQYCESAKNGHISRVSCRS